MIITRDVLVSFNACKPKLERFCELYPDGLDISGLWGTLEEREKTWERLLSDEFLRRQIGWAIGVGLIPSRIVGDFAGMNLTRAEIRRADLCWADFRQVDFRLADLRWTILRKVDLRKADLRWTILRWADLRWADLRWADLTGADLLEADLRDAIMSEDQREYAIKQGAIC